MQQALEGAKARAAAAYNAASDHFDDPALSFWDRYGLATIDRLNLSEGASVLDVGCGSGASALPAAHRVGPTGRVIGVDLAEQLLQRGRAKAAAMGMTQVEFRQADMEKLDFDDGAFDAVVSVFSIFFVPDMVSQVRQLWRCVRPGGQLAITTWGPRMFEPGSSIWWNAVGQVRPDLLTAFKPWERITTPDTLEGLLIDSGIRGAVVVPEEGRQPLAHPDDWWTVILGSGYRWTVDQMSADDARDVRRICDDILHRQAVSAIETNVVYAVATRM